MAGSASRNACVIGWPIGHSRSPLIHNYWLRQHGIAGEYRAEAVAPEAFPEFLKSLPERHYVGANATLPHKEAALRLSLPDDRAEAVGAANTLWFESGSLRSTNTDVEGFLANLDASATGWDQTSDAVVLGAGGSARAVVFGLRERGIARIHVVNRTAERAVALRTRFGEQIHPASASELSSLLTSAGVLVNTTSLGMRGQPPLVIDIAPLRSGAVVCDLVYAPLQTELLKAARAAGHRTADGLGMLLHQAVRGFSLWFGTKPSVTPELRTLIEADLAKT
ncbi:MAG: shikimate dehydrogenase [Xanthobacteraceae bacterium]|nr:shikimate dehydrogenase [Xanthobacteraceae bacterium]